MSGFAIDSTDESEEGASSVMNADGLEVNTSVIQLLELLGQR